MEHRKLVEKMGPSLTGERGVGLLWALVSVAIMSAIVWSFSILVDSRTKERSHENLRQSRDYVYKSIRIAAMQPSAIFLSSEADASLKKCIEADSISDCSHTSEANAKAFSLIVPLSRDLTMQTSTLTTVSASDAAGGFDRFGNENCPNNATCMFRGSTKFWLECPPSGTRCQTSGRIRIRVEVTKNPGYDPESDQLSLTSLMLGTKSSGKEEEDVLVTVASLRSADLQRCPSGAHVVGVDSDGAVLCRCLLGPTKTGNIVDLKCPAVTCPDGKELIGLEKVSDDVNAANLSQYKLKCKDTSFDKGCTEPPVTGDVRYFECPANNLMTGFYNPSCIIPLPAKLKELDALIEANKWTETVRDKWKKKPPPGHWTYKTKTYKCGRKDVDCWLKFVQIKCAGGGVRCCPRP
jgi:hypothetical protein